MLTALENVELPLKLTNLKKAERMEHAITALKLVGLGDRLHHLPRQLSGGQEQRVAIARAIVTDPALILADEPTGNLDAASAQDVRTILSRLNKEFGKTIVMVTHDPQRGARRHRAASSGEGRADNVGGGGATARKGWRGHTTLPKLRDGFLPPEVGANIGFRLDSGVWSKDKCGTRTGRSTSLLP